MHWLFDPKGDMFPAGQPRLQGLALSDGGYARLTPRLADGLEMIRSGVLGLDLRAEGEFIRMRDPATREDILHQAELKALAERETARAQREAARREVAEARAKREAVRAKREAERAQREAADRLVAQARVAELEAALQLVEGRALELAEGRALELAEERALRRLRGRSTT